MPRARRNAGTSLIEVLVVMVIFLVGILAVIQIFPKGFQILLLSRNASIATALSRDEIERLKSRPDHVPEAIVALYPDGTIDVNRSPFDLGAAFTGLLQNGTAELGATPRGTDWARFAGANTTRHVIGEGIRIPAPRQIGATGSILSYGSPSIVQFGPVDSITGGPITAYGNDLNVRFGDWNPEDTRGEYDAYLVDPDTAPTLRVASGKYVRNYRVSFSAFVDGVRRDFSGLSLPVPTTGLQPDINGVYPLYSITLSSLLVDNGFTGVSLGPVDKFSLRVQRQFSRIPNGQNFDLEEPYEFKVMNPQLGVLLFNPIGYSTSVLRGSGKEQLQARVDYDVLDWRILREEFRFPYGLPAQHRLAVGSLKVGLQSGSDGRPMRGIPNLEGEDPETPTIIGDSGHLRADHFVLVDLDTGGIYMEHVVGQPATTLNPIVTVDKTTGLINVRDIDNDPTNGTTVQMLLPDGTYKTDVQIDNRALRALYMVRGEYAVQVMKSPSLFASSIVRPGYGQFYVGGSNTTLGGVATRIYFPISDSGRKVTIGEINYRINSGLPLQQILGQDFVIRAAVAGDPIGLPYVDITEALPFLTTAQKGTTFIDSVTTGVGARDVKSASIAVRTIWNPDFFTLSEDPAENMKRLDRWGRGYRRSTNETFLEQGGVLR